MYKTDIDSDILYWSCNKNTRSENLVCSLIVVQADEYCVIY